MSYVSVIFFILSIVSLLRLISIPQALHILPVAAYKSHPIKTSVIFKLFDAPGFARKVSLGINFAKPIFGGIKHFSGLQRRKMQFAGSCNAEQMPKPSRKASFRAKPWTAQSI